PEIGQLTNLNTLYLSANQLSQLPPEIGQLTNLKELDLSENQLSQLPPEIGQLTNLNTLYLSANQLSQLPPEIGQLTNLNMLDLRNNPLPIPPEILRELYKPKIILDYWKDSFFAPSRPLNEAKMLLVGQGSVGKTSLVNRLVDNDFNPSENKTDGIEIRDWMIRANDCDVKLNVWDFGGQEIMHATHQFFLTKRSLYLVVVDARQGEDENRLEYWLKIINSFGGTSPIIVVGNKTDQNPLDLDRRGLTSKYPQIKAFTETSCATGKGIDRLKTAITTEIDQLDHVFDSLPIRWFDIKKQLEDLEKDYIPYEAYQELCKEQGIDEEDKQSTLIGFLHDLGIVLNFQDDPRLCETNILNPEWVTNAVYKILNDKTLFTDNQGVLEKKMLTRILDRAKYPKSKHLLVVDMMRKFELCFDLTGYQDRHFLIPDLLPKEEPDTGDWSNTLAFQFRYKVLPSSIITRFIVRKNDIISRKTYWRNGVVLSNEGNRALVKADREEKIIYIFIDGPTTNRRNLLAIIRSTFKSIHTTIPGLVVAEKVPIPGHPSAVVDYDHLMKLERRGITEHFPEGADEPINVKQLLDGVESAYQRQSNPESLREEQRMSKVEMNFYGNVGNVAGSVERDFNVNERGLENLSETVREIETLLEQLKASNPTVTDTDRQNFLNVMFPSERRQKIARDLEPTWESQIPQFFSDSTQQAVVTTVLQDWRNQMDFDVFLCHNSSDKPTVRQLGQDLQNRNLTIWLDEWELVPGQPWQEALEAAISQVKAAAVLVGKDGFGPWQDREMRAFLSEFVDREVPVIPVLLPGAPTKPDLPIFLKQFTWVDLRSGLTKEGCDRLQWGITGQKPN
ncbi:MAG: COR domain-containing protein, partial [Cyanobacteria bacterium P01_F01_bin.33]